MTAPVTIELGRAEALVLFELLHRLEDEDVTPEDHAEQVALLRLSGALERTLVEPFRPDYRELLERARSQLIDSSHGDHDPT